MNSSATSATHESHLDPSELGTKEYWDALYNRELQNYGEDNDDEGTIWFNENNAEETVVRKLTKLEEGGYLRRRHGNDSSLDAGSDDSDLEISRLLDLGTGNGHMLFRLCENNDEYGPWEGEMVGVDYSEASVELARRIATQRHDREGAAFSRPRFECWDLFSNPPADWLGEGFDVILDKGTFDAISLMQRVDASQSPCEIYREKVAALIKPGCFLFITSCNWTKEELLEWITPPGGEFQFFDEARYPTFTFGGKTGQSIVTIVLQKRSQ